MILFIFYVEVSVRICLNWEIKFNVKVDSWLGLRVDVIVQLGLILELKSIILESSIVLNDFLPPCLTGLCLVMDGFVCNFT